MMFRRRRRRRMVVGGAVVVGSTEAMLKMSEADAMAIQQAMQQQNIQPQPVT